MKRCQSLLLTMVLSGLTCAATAIEPEVGYYPGVGWPVLPPFSGPNDYYPYPDLNTMQEYQTQSGEQQQYMQYYQGQAALLNAKRQAASQRQRQEQAIGESLVRQYQQQIEQQTKQAAPPPIVLPNM